MGTHSVIIDIIIGIVVVIGVFVLIQKGPALAGNIREYFFGVDIPDDPDNRSIWVMEKFAEFLDSAPEDIHDVKEVPCVVGTFPYAKHLDDSKYYIAMEYEGPEDGSLGDVAYKLYLYKRIDGIFEPYKWITLNPKVSRQFRDAAVSVVPFAGDSLPTEPIITGGYKMFLQEEASLYVLNTSRYMQDASTFVDGVYVFGKHPTLYVTAKIVQGGDAVFQYGDQELRGTAQPLYLFDPIGLATGEDKLSINPSIVGGVSLQACVFD